MMMTVFAFLRSTIPSAVYAGRKSNAGAGDGDAGN